MKTFMMMMIKMIFIIIKIVFITIRIIFIILILIILYQSTLHSVSNKRECFPLKVPEEPSSIQEAELDEIPGADQTCADEAAPLENMPIPSVIIEPASSNEGDDDRDGDIISPTAASDNDVTTVETMHDFEAANSDELELKRGDVVLVVPTESAEDQDAGWLTGIKESEWLARGASAQKGLFPENFTQRLE
ncbi:amphiphysin-like isoform X2 [Takifugu rubripes]|uniref:amphiphysin-like isoform X2 n=1 Tax=Takifugu rubripes TaxID=31033 RepID=UPI001145509E|nr:amphiphysin-like isoform X2 [Takifugu rubripes]